MIGFSAGSVVDVSARIIAQKMVESWKQQVITDNRPSAGGIVAAQIVSGANPDGYTLLSVSASHAIAPAMYSKLPYDTQRDFAGITTTVNVPSLLVASSSLGVKTVKDLIAMGKAKPGQLLFSSGGYRQFHPVRRRNFQQHGRHHRYARALQGHSRGAGGCRRRPRPLHDFARG